MVVTRSKAAVTTRLSPMRRKHPMTRNVSIVRKTTRHDPQPTERCVEDEATGARAVTTTMDKMPNTVSTVATLPVPSPGGFVQPNQKTSSVHHWGPIVRHQLPRQMSAESNTERSPSSSTSSSPVRRRITFPVPTPQSPLMLPPSPIQPPFPISSAPLEANSEDEEDTEVPAWKKIKVRDRLSFSALTVVFDLTDVINFSTSS